MGIKINDLQIFYGEIEAVSDVSFDVTTGEIVAIVGESGCGKSTVLKAIAGLVPIRNGEVSFSSDTSLSMVFQNPALFPHLSVAKNVRLPLDLQKTMSSVERSRKVEEILDLVGLLAYQTRLPRELSGGQQQRVSLARAMVTNPSLLLLDEPFGKLDAFTRKRLNKLLLDLWQQLRQTIILVTHDIEEAVLLARKVIILSREKAVVERVVEVDLPYPRSIKTKRELSFFKIVEEIEKEFDF